MTDAPMVLQDAVRAGSLPWPEGLSPPIASEVVAGGWVGETWLAALATGATVIVKRCVSTADVEVDGLAALAAAGVPVPAVLGAAGDVLVLEHVGKVGVPPTPQDWDDLGRSVAGMHQVVFDRFGWHRDNHAGRFVQPNPWTEDWPTFFAEHRVRTHLADRALPLALRRRLEQACDGPLQRRLPERPTPVLTHGDLWMGNTIAGRWVVDPEVSAADRELDLAYMEMSTRRPFPDAFWAGYLDVAPIPDGYAARRPILQLHHRLLQVRHFGAGQLPALETTLQELGW